MTSSSTSPASPGSPSFPPEATRVSARRFVAHLLDGLTFGTVALVTFFGLIFVAAEISDTATRVVVIGCLVGLPTVGHVAYFVLTQRKRGRSPGKYAAGLKVVDARGDVPSSGALVKRSIPLLFEYLYVVAFVAMMRSTYRRRLGDRWADTYVVRDESM